MLWQKEKELQNQINCLKDKKNIEKIIYVDKPVYIDKEVEKIEYLDNPADKDRIKNLNISNDSLRYLLTNREEKIEKLKNQQEELKKQIKDLKEKPVEETKGISDALFEEREKNLFNIKKIEDLESKIKLLEEEGKQIKTNTKNLQKRVYMNNAL